MNKLLKSKQKIATCLCDNKSEEHALIANHQVTLHSLKNTPHCGWWLEKTTSDGASLNWLVHR